MLGYHHMHGCTQQRCSSGGKPRPSANRLQSACIHGKLTKFKVFSTSATDADYASSTPTTSAPDFEALAELAGISKAVDIGFTALGRGIIATDGATAFQKQSVISVPLESALLISDSPLDSISIFGDSHIQRFQQVGASLATWLGDPKNAFNGVDCRWSEVRIIIWWFEEGNASCSCRARVFVCVLMQLLAKK